MKKIIYLFSLLIIILSNATSQNGFYKGTIGEKYPISMTLHVDTSTVTGEYFYDSKGTTLDLYGTIDKNGSINLTEIYGDKETGRIQLTHDKNSNEMTGTWESPDKKKNLNIKIIKNIAFKYLKNKKSNIKCEYLIINLNDKNTQKILNDSLYKSSKREYDSQISEYENFVEEMIKDDTDAVKNYYFELSNSILYYSSSILSSKLTYSSYTGGAHPNYWFGSKSYYYKNGIVKNINLFDIFKKNSNYLKFISDYCIAELKKMEASFVVSGEVKDIINELKEGSYPFIILPNGLMISFSPYAVASYAEGGKEVIIPFNKIRDILDFDGIMLEFKK